MIPVYKPSVYKNFVQNVCISEAYTNIYTQINSYFAIFPWAENISKTLSFNI